jgi:hypothetical protein
MPWRFLRQVVADATGDIAMLVLAGELLRVGGRTSCLRATLRDFDHADHRAATVEQLDNDLLALGLPLPQEVVHRLDQASRIEPGGPFKVNRETFARMMGGRPDMIDMPASKVA